MTDIKLTELSEPESRRLSPKRSVSLSHSAFSIIWAGSDILVLCALFVLTHSFHTLVIGVGIFDPSSATLVGLRFATVFAAIVLIRGNYEFGRLLERRKQMRRYAETWILTFLVFAWFAFLEKNASEFSRGSILLFLVFGGLAFYYLRASAKIWVREKLAANELKLCSAYVIYDVFDQQESALIASLKNSGVEVVGQFQMTDGVDPGSSGAAAADRILADIQGLLHASQLDAVYLFLPWQNWSRISEMTGALQQLPVPVFLGADPQVRSTLFAKRQDVAGTTAFQVERGPLTEAEQAIKRLTDIAIAGIGLILLSPLLLFSALSVKLTSPGPVFFQQSRKGFGGRAFNIYKFRSMTVSENGDTIVQAKRDDTRVTAIGRILRRTSIDELPQLMNVLRGEMSIVGPRPHALAHDNYYDQKIGAYALRQHVKPGLTGWAQINGLRGATETDEAMSKRVDYDLWYINNWSWWLDIRIILRTAVMLLSDRNAY